MKKSSAFLKPSKEHRRLSFTNGCVHGICRSELVLLHSRPGRSLVRNSVSVFTLSRTAGMVALTAILAILLVALFGCKTEDRLQGGVANSVIHRAGYTNVASLRQCDNPKEPSRQTVESEQTVDYVLPAGSAVTLGAPGNDSLAGPATARANSTPAPGIGTASFAILERPVPVRVVAKDRTETHIGAAQKDLAREWAKRAAQVEPVMWAGIVMMTVVAGLLAYFKWWTKAAVAVGIGIAMIVLAQTLPDHGALILLSGVGLFGLMSLIILYAYYKGQFDQNKNGIPDFLEQDRSIPY